MVSSFTLPVWAQLLRHDNASKNPHVLACLEPLLRVAFERVVRPGTLEGGFRDAMVGVFCEADFSSEEDLQDFFALYRNHVLTVMRLIARCVWSRYTPIVYVATRGRVLGRILQRSFSSSSNTPTRRTPLPLALGPTLVLVVAHAHLNPTAKLYLTAC